MKFNATVLTFLSLAVIATASATASAAKKDRASGDALQRRKSLRFDGRTVETAGGGRFNSYTHLDEGEAGKSRKKLYSLPKDFAGRASDNWVEMGYRK